MVEIDESKFGKRKNNCGRFVDGVWIFGSIVWETRKRSIVPVERRDAEIIIPLCQKYIVSGTTIQTDLWGAYSGLSDLSTLALRRPITGK